MMERRDVEEIVESILDERGTDARSGHDDNKPEMVIPVRPFKAFNSSSDDVEVIGVGYFNEMLQFLVIEESEGEIWPVFREHVFKDQKSAQGAANHGNGATA
jgi:hypothetical protein